MEKIGGQFSCESTDGTGTWFRFTLPLPVIEPAAPPPTSSV
jgi:signal transduction histidine kinase